MILSKNIFASILFVVSIRQDVYGLIMPSRHTCSISRTHTSANNKYRKLQATTNSNNNNNNNEFDYLLREVSSSTNDRVVQPAFSRRQISLTATGDISKTILASSFPMPTTQQYVDDDQMVDDSTNTNTNEVLNDDPYANILNEERNEKTGKIQKFQEQKIGNTIENKLKSMDIQDIIVTLFIPGVLAFVSARYVYNRANIKVLEKKEDTLNNFAKEMLYHDGDYKEMELCINDYKKKLVWMGPLKNDAMLKSYLEYYAKKKTVSPQAIASLSYVFTLYQLSEEKAAGILVSLCQSMGTDKISSAGKLLFLGSRIMKSITGKNALLPIKELIMSTYREGGAVAESLIETSQIAMAEAAYRTAVLGGGKKQTSLTPGWEVLGLPKDHATRIYEEEKKIGFLTDREQMYGGQTRKYDKKGRQVDGKTGKLTNPEEGGGFDDDDTNDDTNDDNGVISNVYECGNCGFTMFVAQGRESKFFGANFKCPECGAPKSDFIAKDQMDD